MDDASFLQAMEQDTIIAPILLVEIMPRYFEFYCAIKCGIPHVIKSIVN